MFQLVTTDLCGRVRGKAGRYWAGAGRGLQGLAGVLSWAQIFFGGVHHTCMMLHAQCPSPRPARTHKHPFEDSQRRSSSCGKNHPPCPQLTGQCLPIRGGGLGEGKSPSVSPALTYQASRGMAVLSILGGSAPCLEILRGMKTLLLSIVGTPGT